jgi:hypothetical protein
MKYPTTKFERAVDQEINRINRQAIENPMPPMPRFMIAACECQGDRYRVVDVDDLLRPLTPCMSRANAILVCDEFRSRS